MKIELKQNFNIHVLRHLNTYKIPKALHDLQNIKYSKSGTEIHYSKSIILAGDTALNGSLNAVMLSG